MGGVFLEEIIIIRITNTDEEIYHSIMNVLQARSAEYAKLHLNSSVVLGCLEIRPECRQVLKGGQEVRLNYGEFSILYCMARSPGRVFTREQLYNAAWGEDYKLGTNTVDNTIWRLRRKLEPDPKHPTFIKTVFRLGYKIEG